MLTAVFGLGNKIMRLGILILLCFSISYSRINGFEYGRSTEIPINSIYNKERNPRKSVKIDKLFKQFKREKIEKRCKGVNVQLIEWDALFWVDLFDVAKIPLKGMVQVDGVQEIFDIELFNEMQLADTTIEDWQTFLLDSIYLNRMEVQSKEMVKRNFEYRQNRFGKFFKTDGVVDSGWVVLVKNMGFVQSLHNASLNGKIDSILGYPPRQFPVKCKWFLYMADDINNEMAFKDTLIDNDFYAVRFIWPGYHSSSSIAVYFKVSKDGRITIEKQSLLILTNRIEVY
jgi:hypothetical protein